MNTTGKAWLVCRQFYDRGTRFLSREEAIAYATALAKRTSGERVEVFECVSNYMASIPVIEEGSDHASTGDPHGL